jgi:hypothetical protein
LAKDSEGKTPLDLAKTGSIRLFMEIEDENYQVLAKEATYCRTFVRIKLSELR